MADHMICSYKIFSNLVANRPFAAGGHRTTATLNQSAMTKFC